MSIYAFKDPISIAWLKVSFFTILLLQFLLLHKTIFQPIFWLTVLSYFSCQLFIGYSWAANHHFVAVYLTLAICIFTSSSGFNVKVLSFHIRFLLAAILLLSALHKLLSAEYINGAFMQMQLDFGIFLKPVKLISQNWQLYKEENLAAYREIIKTDPNTAPAYFLKHPIGTTPLLAKLGSWFSIFMEALAGIFIYSFSQKKISHLFLLTTILGVFFFRLETGFLSLLAVMGFWLAPNNFFKISYLILITIFSIMIISGLGFR
jgi:hypothetical protein